MEVDIVKAALDWRSSLLKLVVNSMVRLQFWTPKFHGCVEIKGNILDDTMFIQAPHYAQYFQGYAKPSRLFLAAEPEVCADSSLERILTSFKVGGCKCLYKVKLHTSNIYGSGLSDLNAGILLCLIDENGDSILQRIPASLIKEHCNQLEDKIVSDVLHFQRGSVDEFAFEGPKLGQVEALWISLESGQWRLGDVSLIVTFLYQPTSEENGRKEIQYVGFEYRFAVEDTLLGEGSDISMAELRPGLVREFSWDNLTLLSEYLLQPTSIVSDSGITNEESMREYADLKYSLLLYDGLLVLAGSSIASFSVGENAAFAFLGGGIGGFLYLLLLQKSIDGLPAPAASSASINRRGKFAQIFGRFKGPVSSLVLAFVFATIAVKYGSGDSGGMVLTPKEVVFGMLGFLACKVAVVLAAFKTMPMGLEENE
ncbi:uncharacterized protein LOC114259151 isoform X3 [Camellia sinensis]|uniref:uncharacterized protein LOC114259151 isoform X3 n=1 Tax=Camellia sinensis TaxID=4442 RepID=UPI001035B63C|nr:uncharacterized protein LOC114259151 isoform X3 [Camellia sinensis]XP_028054943.1 uncharacterized protein LOC114259151 isoform X3 [Camellia sinensis]